MYTIKRNYICLCFLLFSTFLKTAAQGNLQFNKSLFIEIPAVASQSSPNSSWNYLGTYTLTVPSGKTVKIESCFPAVAIGGWPVGVGGAQIFLNDGCIYHTGGTNFGPITFCPIWLPAGSYTFKVVLGASSSGGYNVKGIVSCLEFNIVP